jgi:hypothetical protein
MGAHLRGGLNRGFMVSPFCNALTSKDGKRKYLALPETIEAISEPL